MNLKFWKKKTVPGDEAENTREATDDKTVAMEAPDLDTPAKAGILSRVKSGFAGLAGRFKKSPAPVPESEVENHAPAKHNSSDTQADDKPAIAPMNTKKRLIIGGAIGFLVIFLMGIGFAAWTIFLSPQEPEALPPTAADSSQSGPPTETKQDEIEALKKKNDELQAQIEALKKEKPQDQTTASQNNAAEGSAALPPNPGEMTISNKDPKAAAQALKEAIEAMNAGSGNAPRKSTN
jgi:cell division protein FtsB